MRSKSAAGRSCLRTPSPTLQCSHPHASCVGLQTFQFFDIHFFPDRMELSSCFSWRICYTLQIEQCHGWCPLAEDSLDQVYWRQIWGCPPRWPWWWPGGSTSPTLEGKYSAIIAACCFAASCWTGIIPWSVWNLPPGQGGASPGDPVSWPATTRKDNLQIMASVLLTLADSYHVITENSPKPEDWDCASNCYLLCSLLIIPPYCQLIITWFSAHYYIIVRSSRLLHHC